MAQRGGSTRHAAAAGVVAVALAALTARGAGRRLDRRIYRALNGGAGPRADRFFRAITELGSIWASVGAGAVLAARGRRREALDAVGAAGATWAVGQVLKKAWGRPRPYQDGDGGRLLIDRPAGASWPSSHPAVLLAFLTVAGRDLGLGLPTRVGLTGLAGLVAASRVYLGVHYPADVVGGLLVGRAVAELWGRAASPRVLGLPGPAGVE